MGLTVNVNERLEFNGIFSTNYRLYLIAMTAQDINPITLPTLDIRPNQDSNPDFSAVQTCTVPIQLQRPTVSFYYALYRIMVDINAADI